MSEKVVLVRMGENYFSIPFSSVEEILGPDRIQKRSTLPEGAIPEGSEEKLWVSSRDRWIPLSSPVCGKGFFKNGLVVVITVEKESRAIIVDQVVKFETFEELHPFPENAEKLTEFRVSGVRIWGDRVVLELDLSMLI